MSAFQWNGFQIDAFQVQDDVIFPDVAIEVELAGMFSGWTNIASDVLLSQSVVIRHGIHSPSPLDRVAQTGTATFVMNNSASNSATTLGYYSPHHASKRTGWGLGIRCRIRITDPATATVHTRFIGRLDAIDPIPGVKRERWVLVTAVDWLDEAARWRLTPAIGEQIDKSWDSVITDIVREMPVGPADTDLNGGSETWEYALDSSAIPHQTALAEFRKLAFSEYGLIYQKADGTLRAEDRHYRMSVTSSAWTLADADYQGLELPSSRDDLLNTVRVITHPKDVSPAANVVVYNQANVIEFAAGETKMLLGSYRDQTTGDPIGATDIQTQVSGVDYVANTLEDGSGSNVSSSFSVTVTAGQSGVRFDVTNGTGAAAYLTTLQLIGKGIYDYGATIHEATDSSSIETHGEHVLDFDMPYQSRQDVGQAAADYILAKYKDPLAQAHEIAVIGRTPALVTQILTRDISDRITVSETVTGVSDDFFINGIEFVVLPQRFVAARYVLAPTADPATDSYFLIDTSALDGADVLAPF
jgi:hypothetical protein